MASAQKLQVRVSLKVSPAPSAHVPYDDKDSRLYQAYSYPETNNSEYQTNSKLQKLSVSICQTSAKTQDSPGFQEKGGGEEAGGTSLPPLEAPGGIQTKRRKGSCRTDFEAPTPLAGCQGKGRPCAPGTCT